jgi:N-acetylneuraminic acid mutarotase
MHPSPSFVTLLHVASAFFNDLYRFSPTSNTWTALIAASPPTARFSMGFAATPDGMLYVFGGKGSGERGEGQGNSTLF